MLVQKDSRKVTVDYNPKLGFELLKEAAYKGSAAAAGTLAFIYSTKDNDYGVEVDYAKRLCWAEVHKKISPESRYKPKLIVYEAKKAGIDLENGKRFDPNSYCREVMK